MITGSALIGLSIDRARAQADTSFYKGKVIYLLIGVPPGGTVDLEARLIARHLGAFIPGNPTVVAQNMVGAGGIVMANYLNAVAPRDGTAIAILPDTLVVSQAVGVQNIRFDTSKFSWIGSATPRTHSVMIAWYTSGVHTIEEARHTQLLTGASAKGAHVYTVPALLNEFLGTQFKIIPGYQGVTSGLLAMERGELNSAGTTWEEFKIQKPDFIRDKKSLSWSRTARLPRNLPDVPTIQELAHNDADRQAIALLLAGETIGRPLAAPPGIPDDRLQTLRAAFAAMTTSPAFITDAANTRTEAKPISGDTIEQTIARVLATPKGVVDRARKIVE